MKKLAICLVLLLTLCAGTALAQTQTVKTTGTFGQSEARQMLQMINQFRTGSDAWYWNSDNATKTVRTDLKPLVYDDKLEQAAMQRAIEIALFFSHTRPNGKSCFTAMTDLGISGGGGENIAAGYSTGSSVFYGWREDNEDFSGQGHRRNMLSAGYTCVGIGHVVMNGTHYWTQEFGTAASGSGSAACDGDRTMDVEIDLSYVTSIELANGGSASGVTVTYGEQVDLPNQATVKLTETWGSARPILLQGAWTMADQKVATVSGNRVTGVGA